MRSIFRKLFSNFKARLSGVKIGRKTYIAGSATLDHGGGEIILGDICEIHRQVQLLAYGGRISIGNNCSINPCSILYGHGGLTIGNDVRIAANVIIIPANHVFIDSNRLIRQQGEDYKGITIGNDVWLGARVTVLDGVTIADGCVIGAGAVVTKSTEPYGIYVGNPARLMKFREPQNTTEPSAG